MGGTVILEPETRSPHTHKMEARQRQVGAFAGGFLLSNLAFLLAARRKIGGNVVVAAILPLAILPCGAVSGWRLGDHMKQAETVSVTVVCGIALGVGLFRRRLRLAAPFAKHGPASFLPLGISFASAGLGAGYAAKRYVNQGY
ncbi:hypothetical protein BASA81_005550 [Batrachochytrium salamandrivorans]|nr:hypothetical protein BASA81_005550 [Batrachochytrium salamandrivorans]